MLLHFIHPIFILQRSLRFTVLLMIPMNILQREPILVSESPPDHTPPFQLFHRFLLAPVQAGQKSFNIFHLLILIIECDKSKLVMNHCYADRVCSRVTLLT